MSKIDRRAVTPAYAFGDPPLHLPDALQVASGDGNALGQRYRREIGRRHIGCQRDDQRVARECAGGRLLQGGVGVEALFAPEIDFVACPKSGLIDRLRNPVRLCGGSSDSVDGCLTLVAGHCVECGVLCGAHDLCLRPRLGHAVNGRLEIVVVGERPFDIPVELGLVKCAPPLGTDRRR